MKFLRWIGMSLAALSVAACGGQSGSGGAGSANERAIGSTTAPVTFVEYASVACPACAAAHEATWPVMEADYIETGQVRFVFREMIAGSQPIAMTGFALANCVADERYFDAIDLLFQQQSALYQAMSRGGARAQYVAIAATLGLSESQLDACLSDQAILDGIIASHERAGSAGITRTPTYLINGSRLDSQRVGEDTVWVLNGEIVRDADGAAIPADYSGESFSALLDAVIAASGETG